MVLSKGNKYREVTRKRGDTLVEKIMRTLRVRAGTAPDDEPFVSVSSFPLLGTWERNDHLLCSEIYSQGTGTPEHSVPTARSRD